jgi:hypothetical protein
MLSYYIDLGDDITGVSGRPKAATAAIMPMKVLEQPIRSDEASIKVNGYNTDEQEKINNQTDKKGAAFIKEMLTRKGNTSTLFIHHPSLKLYTNSLNAKGEFEYVSHPTLGKCFFATSSVQVRMPFAFSTYAPILIGKSNDRTFWIVELNSSGNTNTESDALSAWQSFTASTYLSEFTAEAKNMLTVKTISIQTKKPIHIKPLSQEVISGSLKIKGLQGYLYKNVSLQNDKNSFTKSEDDLYRGTLLLEMNDIGSNGKDVGIAALAECSNTNSTIHLLNMTACMEIGNEETPFAETNQQAFKAGGNLVFNTLTGMIFGDVYSQSQNISLCTKGNMSIQITPSGYLFTLGNADKLVKISPGCLGVPFNGWIDIEKGRTNFHLALQRSVRFDSDSENLGVCSQVLYGDVGLKFEANFSLPLKTRFQYDGKFSTETQSSIDLTSEYSGNGCTLSPIQVGMFDVIGKSHLTFENNSIAITGQLVATTKINGVMQQIGIHCNKIISRID